MLQNPAILLGLLVGLLAIAFGGYRYGYSRAEDAVSARVAAAQVEAIDEANARTKAEIARTLEQARSEAQARLAATKIRLMGERDAALKARPECARDADSVRLLLESIGAANGATPAGSGVLDALRPATAAGVGQ